MLDHLEVPVLVTILYMVVVLYVPDNVMRHRRPFNLIHLNRAWNLLLTGFSLIGVFHTGIRLWEMLSEAFFAPGTRDVGLPTRLLEAFYPAICVWKEENFFNGSVGFFVLAFILSKPFETFDTVFLVAQKKPVSFLHWYHHVTVMLYGWHAYTMTISSGLIFAVMNYAVHSVMYLYYFLCSCGLRAYIRPIAPFITFLQILQMVLGAVIEAASYYLATYSRRRCDANRQNSKLGLIMYLSYLALFTKLFYENYLCVSKKGSLKNQVNHKSPQTPQKNKSLPNISNGKMKGEIQNKKNS
ncbi:unnamed protein product [Phytomonas sp. Hart1]|nr:unnamed protein product [Phytomonas sp. Hart1]|eukprot:CCW67903.1 unnamed protein product [Phytomonas sp. isolate Hart1]